VWGNSLSTNLTRVEVIGRTHLSQGAGRDHVLKLRKNIDSRQASAHGWILATLSFLLEAGRDKSGAFLENLGRISCKTFQRDSRILVLNFVIAA
jgi:hypothetical protein